jgi:hypothetical protein
MDVWDLTMYGPYTDLEPEQLVDIMEYTLQWNYQGSPITAKRSESGNMVVIDGAWALIGCVICGITKVEVTLL